MNSGIEKGDTVVIPKGTRIEGTGAYPSYVEDDQRSWLTRRRQIVKLHGVLELADSTQLTWVGAGGYWRRTWLNAEILEATTDYLLGISPKGGA